MSESTIHLMKYIQGKEVLININNQNNQVSCQLNVLIPKHLANYEMFYLKIFFLLPEVF